MADIFGRAGTSFGGAFAADAATMTFAGSAGGAGAAGSGTLVQNVQINYQQQIQKLYEIGSNQIYHVGGRTQGTGSIARIIGPRQLTSLLYDVYGNICNVGQNTLLFTFGANCGNGGNVRVTYTCHLVLVTGLGFSLQAVDMMINEQIQFMFSGLTVDQ